MDDVKKTEKDEIVLVRPGGGRCGGCRGGAGDLRGASALCYKRDMRELREWISEKMRRRPRRGTNESESTGKSGQELPANQQAPLRPSYPEPAATRAAEPTPAKVEHPVEPIAEAAPLAEPFTPASPNEPNIVME